MEIYYILIEDLEDYETSDVIHHCLTLDKAMEIAEYEIRNCCDKLRVTIGKSHFNEQGVLADDYANFIKKIESSEVQK